ncbi:hypothetical protein SALBM217S_03186 [Streptomyces griseoloalbus]
MLRGEVTAVDRSAPVGRGRSPRSSATASWARSSPGTGRPVAVTRAASTALRRSTGERLRGGPRRTGPPFALTSMTMADGLDPAGRPASRGLAAAVSTAQETRGRRRAAPPRRKVPRCRAKAVRTPTVLQMEAVECGAASLAMVLGHHGRHVPLEELRIACGVSRDGSRARQPAEGRPQLRADGQGHADGPGRPRRGDGAGDPVLGVQPLRRLRRHGPPLRPPRARSSTTPAKGRRFVPLEEFDGSFTGVVLVLEPGEGLRAAAAVRPVRAGRDAGPAARHRGHPAGRGAGESAAGRGGRGGAGPGPPEPGCRPVSESGPASGDGAGWHGAPLLPRAAAPRRRGRRRPSWARALRPAGERRPVPAASGGMGRW